MNGCFVVRCSNWPRVQPRECFAPHAAPIVVGCSLNQNVLVETSE
ncbi:unnamed protein product, partial [Rotaria magnacalcarata]